MRPRDFALLTVMCLFWASNNVLSKIVVSHWHVPPMFFVALRFAVVALVLLPWLLPVPRNLPRVVAAAVLMGGVSFTFMFFGLKTTSPSVAAVVVQSGIPFTIALSMLMLGERIHWRRGIGTVLTLAGIMLVIWKPGEFEFGMGIVFILIASFGSSLGSILMKQIDEMGPLRFQAWVGLISFPPLLIATLATEQGQWESAMAVGWPFVGAILFAALIVSVFSHGSFFWLIHRYEANHLATLTLMNPLFTFGLGIMITGDRFDTRMAIGAAVTLVGVLIVAMRPRQTAELLVAREQA